MKITLLIKDSITLSFYDVVLTKSTQNVSSKQLFFIVGTNAIITSQLTQNSIRHNLSLHSKFKRVQNEGTGKSSWWTINYEAKNSRPARPRQKQLKGGRGGDVQRSNTMDSSLLCAKKGSKKEGRIRKKVIFSYFKSKLIYIFL